MPSFLTSKTFNHLFLTHYAELVHYAQRKTGQLELAEDVVQDVFCQMWKNRQTLSQPKEIKPYLYASVTYKVFRYYAKNKSEGVFSTLEEPVSRNTEEFLSFEELYEQLLLALAKFSDRDRYIFEANKLLGVQISEIAFELGLSSQTVHNRMNKVVKKLREELERQHHLFF
ncbi:MAG: RNA polymerase sigma factor [Nitritalea sp.]